ncbi:hypothetical protein HU200_019877 [Digitaria exilis]|uniref:Coatomer subunit delta n=1 Tax=Digitaria exilis TaxID=1010633 RepID=A0A835F118_9POAL|nr:hypothetical protein HU200_019877 [Digitaria exilis]
MGEPRGRGCCCSSRLWARLPRPPAAAGRAPRRRLVLEHDDDSCCRRRRWRGVEKLRFPFPPRGHCRGAATPLRLISGECARRHPPPSRSPGLELILARQGGGIWRRWRSGVDLMRLSLLRLRREAMRRSSSLRPPARRHLWRGLGLLRVAAVASGRRRSERIRGVCGIGLDYSRLIVFLLFVYAQVVLAASIVSKSGKALVSRQFVDMSRIRIEGLLAAFPKLVGTGKQHTYVETENVRYVYQPIEALFEYHGLLNICKVPEYSPSLDEEGVCKTAFELIFAFDEAISLGNKENVTVQQVKQYCEMESHEEKAHKLMMQAKINETKDVMKKKANELDKMRV